MGAVKGCRLMAAWANPQTMEDLNALAKMQGLSQSEVLRRLVNTAAARARVALNEELPATGGEKQIAPAHVLADTGAIAL